MNIWLMSFLIPACMIVCGVWLYWFTPKTVNSFFGYRTRKSRMNADTWLFANRYCGKLWLIIGIAFLIPTGIVCLLFANAAEDTVETAALITECVQIAALLVSMIPVDCALRRIFDEKGKRRKGGKGHG